MRNRSVSDIFHGDTQDAAHTGAQLMADATTINTSISQYDTRFFGHPRGLATLFFTEMWERYSYYGTRALLILYMTAATANGGLGFSVMKSGALYGFYTAMVYLLSLPGGWVADRSSDSNAPCSLAAY